MENVIFSTPTKIHDNSYQNRKENNVFFFFFQFFFPPGSVSSGIRSADLLSGKPERRPLCYAAPHRKQCFILLKIFGHLWQKPISQNLLFVRKVAARARAEGQISNLIYVPLTGNNYLPHLQGLWKLPHKFHLYLIYSPLSRLREATGYDTIVSWVGPTKALKSFYELKDFQCLKIKTYEPQP